MRLADNINKSIVLSLTQLRNDIIANHQKNGQVASGKTIQSMRIEETQTGGRLFGRSYFSTLETGRKPGRTPNNFNQIIQQWIIDKGISVSTIPYKRKTSEKWQPKYTPQQRGLMSLAGAVAHTIATEGTKLYRLGGRKDIFTEPTDKAVSKIRKELTAIFKTEIERL